MARTYTDEDIDRWWESEIAPLREEEERQSALDEFDLEIESLRERPSITEPEYIAPEADISLMQRLRERPSPGTEAYLRTITAPPEEELAGWKKGATLLGEAALRGITLGMVGLPKEAVAEAEQGLPEWSKMPARVVGEAIGFVPWMFALGPVGGQVAQAVTKYGARRVLTTISRMMVEGGLYGSAEEAANWLIKGDRSASKAAQNIVNTAGFWMALGAGGELAGKGLGLIQRLRGTTPLTAVEREATQAEISQAWKGAGEEAALAETWKPEQFGPPEREVIATQAKAKEAQKLRERGPVEYPSAGEIAQKEIDIKKHPGTFYEPAFEESAPRIQSADNIVTETKAAIKPEVAEVVKPRELVDIIRGKQPRPVPEGKPPIPEVKELPAIKNMKTGDVYIAESGKEIHATIIERMEAKKIPFDYRDIETGFASPGKPQTFRRGHLDDYTISLQDFRRAEEKFKVEEQLAREIEKTSGELTVAEATKSPRLEKIKAKRDKLLAQRDEILWAEMNKPGAKTEWAIETKDGKIISDKGDRSILDHADLVEKSNIHFDDVKSTGYMIGGKYRKTSIGEIEKQPAITGILPAAGELPKPAFRLKDEKGQYRIFTSEAGQRKPHALMYDDLSRMGKEMGAESGFVDAQGKFMDKVPMTDAIAKELKVMPAGAILGIQRDEEENVYFDPKWAMVGILGAGLAASGMTRGAGIKRLLGLRGPSLWEARVADPFINKMREWKRDKLRQFYVKMAQDPGAFQQWVAGQIRDKTLIARQFPGYSEALELTKRKIGMSDIKAMGLGRKLTLGLTEDQQLTLGKYLRQEGISQETLDRMGLLGIAREAREGLKEAGRMAVERGLLDPATFTQNIDNYIPIMYRQFEKDMMGPLSKMPKFMKVRAMRRAGQRFMYRDPNLTTEQRLEMGWMLEPGYPVAKGYSQVMRDVHKSDFLKTVTDNWSISSAQFKTLSEPEQLLFTHIPVTVIPKTGGKTAYGALAGRYAPAEIATDVMGMLRITDLAEAKLGERLVGWWKYGKAVLNPATQMRNVRNNVILNDINNGVSPVWNFDSYIAAATSVKKHLKTKEMDELYKLALENGVFKKGFIDQETFVRLIDNFAQAPRAGSSVIDILNFTLRKGLTIPGELYGATEDFFRLAALHKLHFVDKLPVDVAAQRAVRGMLNYEEVAPFVARARRAPFMGSPFFTYTYKVIPAIMEGAVRHPVRFLKWLTLPLVMEEIARHQLGLSREKLDKIRESLPERMQSKIFGLIPNHFLLNIKPDKEGKYTFYDSTYEMPWGDIWEHGKTIFGLPGQLIPYGRGPFLEPMVNAVYLAALGKTIDFFSGREITQPWMTNAEAFWEFAKNEAGKLLPANPLVPGSYQFDKWYRSITGTPYPISGDIPSILNTVMSTLFGLKTKEVDVPKEVFWRRHEKDRMIQDVRGKMSYTRRRRDMSDKDKIQQLEYYNQVIREIEQGVRR